jgi:hypothetical protein
MKTEKIVYFDMPGHQNTEKTLKSARERAEALGIRSIVVASSSGETGVLACDVFKGFQLTIVRYHTGFRKPGVQQMKPEYEEKIISSGARLLTTSHALSGVERSIRMKLGTYEPLEIMAETLRLFGNGTKVCIEIAVMAADAGLVSVNDDIVAIGGTNIGADTALVLRPAHSNCFFDLVVKEIIAKPREKKKSQT